MTLADMLALRKELDPDAPDMIVIPDALNRIADKVLAYRPKDKRKKPRKRKRPKKGQEKWLKGVIYIIPIFMTTTLTSDEREELPQTPEQIFIIPTKQWGLIPTTTRPTKSDYVGYVRADVAAMQMRNLCLRTIRDLRHKSETDESRWNVALYHAEKRIESLSLDNVEQKK